MTDSSRAASSDRFRIDGQIAVVTGACGKLGPIWIEALIDAGAQVAALELPGASVSPAFHVVEQRMPGQVQRFDCDVTNRQSVVNAASVVAVYK